MADAHQKARPAWLRVVTGSPNASSAREPRQLQLFGSEPNDSQMALLRMEGLSEAEFVFAMDLVSPALVIDARVVRRFDIGRLNRQAVFSEFQERRTEYFEVGFRSGDSLETQIDVLVGRLGPRPRRVIVMCEGHEVLDRLKAHYTGELPPDRKVPWLVRVLPPEVRPV